MVQWIFETLLKDYAMGYNFLPCDRNQSYLLPPSLADWLPQGHLAWFVLDAVEQIDLKQFYKKYRSDGVGNSAFNPSIGDVRVIELFDSSQVIWNATGETKMVMV